MTTYRVIGYVELGGEGGGTSTWGTLDGKPTPMPSNEATVGTATTERTINAATLKAAIEAIGADSEALAALTGRVGDVETAVAGLPAPPTVDTLDGLTTVGKDLGKAASKADARSKIDAADVAAVVALTGDQAVAGVKTFSASPVVPAPTDSGHAVNLGHINGLGLGEIDLEDVTNPASTVTGLITGRRLSESCVANQIATGQTHVLRPVAGVWPALSTVPEAYLDSGLPIIWDSSTDAEQTAPAEQRTNDIWRRRKSS